MAEHATANHAQHPAVSDAAPPAAGLCAHCGSPVEPLDKFCPACGAAHARPTREGAGARRHFQCQTCGSQIAVDPNVRSYSCPFCDSNYVVELPADSQERHAPEFVIGFAVTRDQAMAAYRKWLKRNSWFRPGDLSRSAMEDRLQGVYLPFWMFAMLAESRWSAHIGEYWWRTETYTTVNSKGKRVTRTRRVRETEWWPLEGRHHQYQSGYLVSASESLPHAQAKQLEPFQLPALKRYEPWYLAGWMNEEHTVDRAAALDVCQRAFEQRQWQNVQAFLPGDTHRSLHVDTEFSHISSDLCLLPVYLLSYRYQDKVYRFLLNGQTGKATGDKPVSWTRVTAAIIVALAVAAAIGIAVAVLGR